MKLIKGIFENFRGIGAPVEIIFNTFNCIVGRNDVGKSTILKALDFFLNDKNPSIEDKNVYSDSSSISVQLIFENNNVPIILDDTIEVTLESEELVNADCEICVTKIWDTTNKTIKPKIYITRKKYEVDDFVLLDETKLIQLCEKYSIETSRANGAEFNNKEKRDKLRAYYKENSFRFEYVDEELPTTGQTRTKKILDALKMLLPSFEYFSADSSLSDSDTNIQKYFKEKAFSILKEQVDTEHIESSVKEAIATTLLTVTEKINNVLPDEEQILAQIDFDWSKIISTAFKCAKDDIDIPLGYRGDGFRRITMMAYFEMRAEEKHGARSVIFGFEEPETFLHPETQKQLYSKLIAMCDNGYQVFITTHSPIIVAESNMADIIFITKNGRNYTVTQDINSLRVRTIVEELGVKADDAMLQAFERVKGLLLVEGPDDVIALTHAAILYKENGYISDTFEELDIHILPIGGCGAVKNWTNLNIISKLGKPFFIFLDSDKEYEDMVSPNYTTLISYGYRENNFLVSRKRHMESYVPPSYFAGLVPPITIMYSDWDNVKNMCGQHADAGRLGGKSMCERHFNNLTIDHLRASFCPDGQDDEFLKIYEGIRSKLPEA